MKNYLWRIKNFIVSMIGYKTIGVRAIVIRDHQVLLGEMEQQDVQCHEIEESRWFDLDKLPDDISPATKRRLEEYLQIRPLTEKW